MLKIEDGILNGIIDKMKNILHIQKGSLTSDKNEAIIDYDEKFGFKEIEGVHTKEEDLKNTNPKYSKD